MKTLYDEITHPPRYPKLKKLIAPLVWVLIPCALLGIFCLCRGSRTLMNRFVNSFTHPVHRILSRLCEVFTPYSAAEALWLLAILAALIFLVRTIWLLIRRPDRLLRLVRRVLALISALLFLYAGYTALWGVCYYADDFTDLSGITPRGATVEELTTLTASFASALNECADAVPRDENGIFDVDLNELFSCTSGIYDGICAEFPFLTAEERTPKMLVSSRLMSILDFTGFFFPFTGEALLNVDSPECLIPATILHELAHQRGIAEEDECNFVAILAGLRCDDPVYRYSSALLGFIHLGNALYSADPETYYAIRAALTDSVSADLADNSAYWAQFDSPLDQAAVKVSNTVYEGFLQSYDQTDGLRTYGRCVDLLVAYYFDGYRP